ncbi:MAG: NUDIX domain-containing protein [Ruminococcus sp.]|nr:NUDIX domain-containing protein [Ruminococcus sp.]
MKRLLLLDGQDYDENMPEILRTAVRGIIETDGGIVFVEDKFGVLKLPGGGQDEGETNEQTLAREVKEETGLTVIPESIREFGFIEEKRRSIHEEMIWHQLNYIYFCKVESTREETNYSENEKRCEMRPVIRTFSEAIDQNQATLEREGRHAWNQREYKTLMLLKEYFDK